MPWKSSDAQEHTKAADTPEKQKRWAEVANSALARCLKEGGKQGACEASAIKQANSVMAEGELEAKSVSLPMVLTKAKRLADGRVRWQARANTGEFDLENERFEGSFFDDVIYNAVRVQAALSKGDTPPDDLPIPILDVAHYSFMLPPDKRNLARAGWPERVWRDGKALMALGYFDDTPLGRLAAKAAMERPVEDRRISIGVWPDWGRVELTEDGKRIYKGGRNRAYLDHLAMTGHPIDPGTILEVKSMDQKTDAQDVLGDSDEAKGLIDELEEAKGKGLPEGAVVKADEADAGEELDAAAGDADGEPEADDASGEPGADETPPCTCEPKGLTEGDLKEVLTGVVKSFGEALDKRLEPLEALSGVLETLEAKVEALGATEGEKVKAAVDSGGVWWEELVDNSVRRKSAVKGEAKGPKVQTPDSDFKRQFVD